MIWLLRRAACLLLGHATYEHHPDSIFSEVSCLRCGKQFPLRYRDPADWWADAPKGGHE